jgi:hypothetical protein
VISPSGTKSRPIPIIPIHFADRKHFSQGLPKGKALTGRKSFVPKACRLWGPLVPLCRYEQCSFIRVAVVGVGAGEQIGLMSIGSARIFGLTTRRTFVSQLSILSGPQRRQ